MPVSRSAGSGRGETRMEEVDEIYRYGNLKNSKCGK
jgi:hypothetical protein